MGVSKKIPLTIDIIKSCLAYEPDTGHLRWLVQRGYRRKIGDVAGSDKGNGYMQVGVCGNVCHAHRIAWAIAHDIWPIPHQIDHINMNRSDNRLCNLRKASNAQNMRNRTVQSNNPTGAKGVTRHSYGGFCASITTDGSTRYLGYFETIEEAKAAYDAAAKELHGEFYRK